VLSSEALLEIWERGRSATAVQRSLQLLSLALPGSDHATLSAFDLGRRDWRLLGLRREWFGRELAGRAECPNCGEPLEVAFDSDVVAAADRNEPPIYTSRDGRRWRLPTLDDLASASGAPDAATGAGLLFERCSLDSWPDAADGRSIFDEVDAGLAALSADRGVVIEAACPDCGEQSRYWIDPGEFLWSEIAERAAALLDDVHRLASVYGWSEREILGLSATRRAAYLDRVNR
jgi:hypothetical protein